MFEVLIQVDEGGSAGMLTRTCETREEAMTFINETKKEFIRKNRSGGVPRLSLAFATLTDTSTNTKEEIGFGF